MFSQSNTGESSNNELSCEENKKKWQGLLVSALHKVQKQVHSTLSAKDDACQYIENLIFQLVDILCASQPHNVQDVEERVQKTFPHPIDKWANTEAQNALDKGKKKYQLVLPVDKIHPLVKELLGYKIDHQVTVYIVAVLEYIAADILKLTGNYVKNIKHQEIVVQDIKVAMCADKVLMDMFFQDDDEDDFTLAEEQVTDKRPKDTYEEIVKDFILEENQYLRDLMMIIKVFREPFAFLFPRSQDIDNIFSNILDVHELTTNLLSSIEDTLEVNENCGVPLFGGCFEDMAEGAEFDVYFKYTEDNLKPKGKERLYALLQRSDVQTKLENTGDSFQDVVKYVLPKLLLGPIFHCLHYFDLLQNLKMKSDDEEDQESLNNAYSVMHKLKVDIENKLRNGNLLKRKPGDFMTLRFQGRRNIDAALKKMTEMQKQIDGFEDKNIGRNCHEFIMEGVLFKYLGKKQQERYVFLFDGLLVFTKQNLKGRSSVTGNTSEYKLKEKYNIRKIEICDREDNDDYKNSFELIYRRDQPIILSAKTAEEKANWMATLLSLLKRSMLERLLDTKLSEEAKQQPWYFPASKDYKFAEEDSDENIVFEDGGTVDSPLIKGGTLVKLVERLTYHMYAEPKFVKTFLTTYRTFCKPVDLLELLIDRFNIPEPPLALDNGSPDGQPAVLNRDVIKRFRKEYSKPVQFRVLNVLRHWVDHHWCDFDWNRDLLYQLQHFLDSVKGKAMKRWIESIQNVISRKLNAKGDGTEGVKQITYPHDKPPIEWHLERNPEEFHLMKLHPIEIARQVTLLEFDMYKAVKPSELVGTVWMKKQKNITSPNLLKTIDHSTRFTFWLEKCILEAECFEERVSVVSRILEIMTVFQELNNFNGVLEVVSALNSAPIHRLDHTFEEVDQKHHKLMKAFDDAKELNSDHYKKYYEKLRSINPPCVPFLGGYLTNILLTEEGNPDFLPKNPGIINFSKRRKVAAICGEIQQYQNQPYCLEVEPTIREFFKNLNPLGNGTEKEFTDSLYDKSLEVEPRNAKQPNKFEKKYAFNLKSPGVKLRAAKLGSHSSGVPLNDKSGNSVSSVSLNESIKSSVFGSMSLNDTTSLRRYNTGTDDESLTPSTPLTPPHNPDSVFSLVNLPNSDTVSLASTCTIISNSSLISEMGPPTPVPPVIGQLIELEPVEEEAPPPLPPRKKKDAELSPVKTSTSNFLVHDASATPPPPLPPRVPKERGGSLGWINDPHLLNLQGTMTLPRSSHPFYPTAVTTLPRRNSERDHLNQPTFVNVKSDRGGSVTPELPPKTYNRSVIHSRQQSS